MILLQPLRGADLAAEADVGVPWLWEGLLAGGSVTLLTGLWKAGKSTLLSILLGRRRQGGVLLDRVVQPGGSAVVTEEPADIWRRRARHLDFGPDLALFCRPFPGVPDRGQWRALVDQLAEEQRARHIDLVAIDPLSSFLPDGENNAAQLMDALQPLRQLTDRGMAVLLLHHPAKQDHGLGKAARGSGALSAFADIVLEWRLPTGSVGSYQRRLLGFSRFQETPRQLLVEMHVNGTHYQMLDDRDISDDFSANWDTIHAIATSAATPLTRNELLERWPANAAVPHPATLWRWLSRAVELGLMTMDGKGTKGEPHRFGVRAAS